MFGLSDIQNVLQQFFIVSVSFAAIVWIGVFILKWKLPFLIGRSGEKFVSKKLSDLDPIKYTILDNLMLPSDGNISTTQVDHVVVSNFGIFVIETKSYSGWIFGNAYQRNWTQVIYRYKKKFYNPLYQNYAHTKALETLIRPFYPKLPIIGFVAFPSAEKLQVSGTNAVGQARDIVRKIQSYTTEIISDADKTNVVEILTAYNLKDKQTRTSHLKSARNLKRARGF